MTVNEFNSRIHLPTLALSLGMNKDYSYRKLPTYGWLGYNQDMSHVFDVFELLSAKLEDIKAIYRKYTIEDSSFQEYKFYYSEVSENKLFSSFARRNLFSSLWSLSVAEAANGEIRIDDKVKKLEDVLTDLGILNFSYTGIGLITSRVINQNIFKSIGLEDTDINKLIIPTFYAPDYHFATLETFDLGNLDNRKLIYTSGEKGWYGELNKTIVGSINDLLSMRGCTWDPKIEFWTTKPVNIHTTVTVPQCLEIWTQSSNLTCSNSPLEIIRENNGLSLIKNHLKDLPLIKVKELEKLTGEKLTNHWISNRNLEADVFGTKFICKNNRYYIKQYGIENEYSNFSIKLTGIKKEEGDFYQYGFIHMNDSETMFRAKRKVFNSYRALLDVVTNVLLEAGVGVPMVSPNQKHYITNVIDAFNPDNPIENTAPAPRVEVIAAKSLLPESTNGEVLHSQTPSQVHPCLALSQEQLSEHQSLDEPPSYDHA